MVLKYLKIKYPAIRIPLIKKYIFSLKEGIVLKKNLYPANDKSKPKPPKKNPASNDESLKAL